MTHCGMLRALMKRPTLLFLGFVLLLAGRDILSELFLKESGICLAFLNCLVLTVAATFGVVGRGRFGQFLAKLRRPAVRNRSLVLGALAAVIYGVTFYMVKSIGAGLFNLVDFGLAPLITSAIGIVFFQDRWRPDLPAAFLLYLSGLVLLTSNQPMFGRELVLIALLSPVSTAISDGLTKWLRSEEGGGLTRSELLFVRFLPATAFLWLASFGPGMGGLHFNEPGKSLLVAVVCGFGPLWLYCTAVAIAPLTECAIWELLIPGLAFFGTLPAHWEEHTQVSALTGACLILFAFVAAEFGLVARLLAAYRARASRAEGSPALLPPT